MTTLQSEYTDHYQQIRAIVYSVARGADRRANCIAWSWELFLAARASGQAPAAAAVSAARAATRKRRAFGAPSRQGRTDALCHVAAARVDTLPARDEPEPEADPLDGCPTQLRPYGLLLLAGVRRGEIACRRREAPVTVRTRIEQLGEWLETRRPS